MKNVTGYGFALPALLLYVPFVLLPFLGTGYMSLYDWEADEGRDFVGWENFKVTVETPEFRQSFFNTLIYLVATIGLEVCVGLAIALVLHAGVKGGGLYQGFFFAPVVLSMTLVGLLWKFVLDPYFGLLNLGLY